MTTDLKANAVTDFIHPLAARLGQVAASTASPHRRVIEPRSGWQAINFEELWRYRELLYFLTWRDVKVRYKQTVLGASWAIIQPVMTMAVFTIFFGRFGGMAAHVEESYPIFVYSGLLPWTFLAGAVGLAGQSLVASSHLISKVYFPRLMVPMAAVGGGLVDFAISLGVMLILMFVYGVPLRTPILLVPFFVVATVLASLGVGALLAALTIAYRDFRHVIAFLIQIWMFASPVAYPLDVVPERFQLIYALNPMVGIIDGFRACFLDQPFRWPCITVSLLSTGALLAIGVLYFRRVERRFADII